MDRGAAVVGVDPSSKPPRSVSGKRSEWRDEELFMKCTSNSLNTTSR